MASSIVRYNKKIAPALLESQLHPLLKVIYANRNVTELEQVDYQLAQLLDFSLLKDINKAANLIADVVISNKRIIVVGDFDVDGATSTAVMLRSLKSFGFYNVDYLVPNRFDYGYGLSEQIVDVAATMLSADGNNVDMIVTVDNGVSSFSGVARANQLGIDVVITDHHLCADKLPKAAAIVNPNQPDCPFPEKSIAGVGVAFYLMLALRAKLREKNWFDENKKEPNMAKFLDLVALGTVADVVSLEHNNRILVETGLNRIRNNHVCVGIKALLDVAGKTFEKCSTQEFGFIIGPRLNAAGRLDDMSVGIECLLTDDTETANNYAKILNQMNLKRRSIEHDMLEQATVLLEQEMISIEQDNIPPAFALYNKNWHQGIVGLLSSRIKEKYYRPVFAFADANKTDVVNSAKNKILKGSGRSINGVHLRDILDVMDKKDDSLIEKFGGHAMAAGLTIKKENFLKFQKLLAEVIAENVSTETLQNIIQTDGCIAPSYLNLETAQILKYASPWGQNFPEPLFDDVFILKNWKVLVDKHLKMQLQHPQNDREIEAIAFNQTENSLPDGERIHLVYRLDVNEFRGNKNLQLIVQKITAPENTL